MPKKGKKGKKKGGKKKAKGPANAAEVMQALLKCYERNCLNTDSRMCPRIVAALRGCIENNAILSQVSGFRGPVLGALGCDRKPQLLLRAVMEKNTILLHKSTRNVLFLCPLHYI